MIIPPSAIAVWKYGSLPSKCSRSADESALTDATILPGT